MKIYILLILLICVSSIFSQENRKTELNQILQTEAKESINSNFRGAIALTSSVLVASSFEQKEGILSYTGIEMFIGGNNNNFYYYGSFQVMVPIIFPKPLNFLSGNSFIVGAGFGYWLYKNISINNMGHLVGINVGFLSSFYNSYLHDTESLTDSLFSGTGLQINLRHIYKISKHFGFIYGIDMIFLYRYSFFDSSKNAFGLTGGITAGITF